MTFEHIHQSPVRRWYFQIFASMRFISPLDESLLRDEGALPRSGCVLSSWPGAAESSRPGPTGQRPAAAAQGPRRSTPQPPPGRGSKVLRMQGKKKDPL